MEVDASILQMGIILSLLLTCLMKLLFLFQPPPPTPAVRRAMSIPRDYHSSSPSSQSSHSHYTFPLDRSITLEGNPSKRGTTTSYCRTGVRGLPVGVLHCRRHRNHHYYHHQIYHYHHHQPHHHHHCPYSPSGFRMGWTKNLFSRCYRTELGASPMVRGLGLHWDD